MRLRKGDTVRIEESEQVGVVRFYRSELRSGVLKQNHLRRLRRHPLEGVFFNIIFLGHCPVGLPFAEISRR